MPRHALRSELAAKLADGWTGQAGRHALNSEMPNPAGAAGRHALAAEVDGIVTGPPLTSPEFHGKAQNKGFTASHSIGAITGVLSGDVLLAFASGNDGATMTPPAGQGWALIGDSGAAASARLLVYAATATSTSQAGGTWTWSNSHNHEVVILAYGGAVTPTTAPTVRVSGPTTINTPSVTSTAADAMLVCHAFFATGGTAPAWPGTMTVRHTAVAASAAGTAADEARPVAGATGARTFNSGGTPSALAAASVILEPVG